MQMVLEKVTQSLQLITRKNATNTDSPTAEGKALQAMAINRGDRSMIGSGVNIQGDLISEDDLVIQGQINGSITAEASEVMVGVEGRLTACIRARVVKIEGKVTGDITAIEKVIVAKTGDVTGNIRAPRVNLEDGAKFKGSIEMDPDYPVASPSQLEITAPALSAESDS